VRTPRRLGVVALAAMALFATAPAAARLTHLQIERDVVLDLPVFGATGPYRKLSGVFEGELAPENPRNAVIVDLSAAPRVSGKVRYRATFTILQPADPAKANGRLFYMFNNRGSKLELRLNDAGDSNDPTSAADFGNGWLNRQGYAIAWSGWDGSVPERPGLESITLPVAQQPDGQPLTGNVAVELVPAQATVNKMRLPYPPATRDAGNGRLTVRERAGDPRTVITGWDYTAAQEIQIPAPVRPQWIYEFVYTARDPKVMGIGHAATRDFLSFLRDAPADDSGTRNPLGPPGTLRAVYSFGRSQGGRAQRDFLYWGFNTSEDGTRGTLIDGMIPYATGAGLLWMNFRFAQPNVSSQQHIRARARELEGPHAYPVLTDPLTRTTDGIFNRCLTAGACPKVMNVDSANEYWNKSSSLNHTDGRGRDLNLDRLAPNVRLYAVASLPHSAVYGDRPQVLPACQQLSNPLYQGQLFRALIVALDQWVTAGREPPASQIPRRRDRTLVRPDQVRFPRIPARTYAGWPVSPAVQFAPQSHHTHPVLDFSVVPPVPQDDRSYAVQVSQVDADGNEVGGLRLPLLAAPVGTYTGWSLLKPGAGAPDLCAQAGQFIPFARTKAERIAAGDARRSLEERYGTAEAYEELLDKEVTRAIAERLLLPEDAAAVRAEGIDQFRNPRYRAAGGSGTVN
jgi:hypothetical protein